MEKFKKGDIIINIETKKIEKVYHIKNNNLTLYSKYNKNNVDNIPMVKGGNGEQFNANNYMLLTEYKKREKQPTIWDLIKEQKMSKLELIFILMMLVPIALLILILGIDSLVDWLKNRRKKNECI